MRARLGTTSGVGASHAEFGTGYCVRRDRPSSRVLVMDGPGPEEESKLKKLRVLCG